MRFHLKDQGGRLVETRRRLSQTNTRNSIPAPAVRFPSRAGNFIERNENNCCFADPSCHNSQVSFPSSKNRGPERPSRLTRAAGQAQSPRRRTVKKRNVCIFPESRGIRDPPYGAARCPRIPPVLGRGSRYPASLPFLRRRGGLKGKWTGFGARNKAITMHSTPRTAMRCLPGAPSANGKRGVSPRWRACPPIKPIRERERDSSLFRHRPISLRTATGTGWPPRRDVARE